MADGVRPTQQRGTEGPSKWMQALVRQKRSSAPCLNETPPLDPWSPRALGMISGARFLFQVVWFHCNRPDKPISPRAVKLTQTDFTLPLELLFWYNLVNAKLCLGPLKENQ